MGQKKTKRTRKPITLESAGARDLRLASRDAVLKSVNRLYSKQATGNLTVCWRAGSASNIEFESIT